MFNKKLIFILSLGGLVLVATWLQYHNSYYGLGIFLIPVLGIIAVFFGFVISKFVKRTQLTLWKLSGVIWGVFLLSSIGWVLWDEYKPTLQVVLPPNYSGMVHILPSDEVGKGPVYVSQSGIAWVPHQGEYEYKITQGEEDITNVLNEYGRSNYTFWDSKKSDSIIVYVTCISIRPGTSYPSSPWNQWHARCFSKTQLDSVLQLSEEFKDTKNPRVFGVPKKPTPSKYN